MRKQLVKTVEALMGRDPRIVLLLGDIGVFGFRNAFAQHPERTYNIGICEQAMTSLAAGLAKEGCIPVIHSIAPFVVERCFEQLKIDLGYQELSGNVISVGASYDYAALGCTHHCPGDVQLMRSIPGMRIVVPGTPVEFDKLFRESYAHRTPGYYRLSERSNSEDQSVEFGKGHVLRRGKRGTVLAVGPTLNAVLEATTDLDVTILYYTTLSPFDGTTLAHSVAGDRLIMVEPFYTGTLAHDVLETLADRPPRMRWIGIPRQFRTSYGNAADHDQAAGLTAPQIRAKIQEILDVAT